MGTDIYGFARKCGHGTWRDLEPIPDDRNYVLFEVLNNNWPIATEQDAPDWFPTDLYIGDHSYGSATVGEILDWEGWEGRVIMSGLVSRDTYEQWDKSGEPKEHSAIVWARDQEVVIVDEEDMPVADYTHVRVSWTIKLADRCEMFLLWCEYIRSRYGSDTRLVWGFD